MDATDFTDFSSGLANLSLALNGQADDAVIRAYWLALEDLPAKPVLQAIQRGVMFFDHFPKPVELRRSARDFMQAERDAEDAKLIPRALPAQRFTFLLGLLADPNVPAAEKERAKAHWKKSFTGEVPPWNEAR